jgi:hypothetical protein
MDVDSNGTIDLDKFTAYLQGVNTAEATSRDLSSAISADGSHGGRRGGRFSGEADNNVLAEDVNDSDEEAPAELTRQHSDDNASRRSQQSDPRRGDGSSARGQQQGDNTLYLADGYDDEASGRRGVAPVGSSTRSSPVRSHQQSDESDRHREYLQRQADDVLRLLHRTGDGKQSTKSYPFTPSLQSRRDEGIVPVPDHSPSHVPLYEGAETQRQAPLKSTSRRSDNEHEALTPIAESFEHCDDHNSGYPTGINRPSSQRAQRDDASLSHLRSELRELENQLAQSHKEAMDSRGKIRLLEIEAADMNNSFRSFRERSAMEIGEKENHVESLMRQLDSERKEFNEKNADLIAECGDLKVTGL